MGTGQMSTGSTVTDQDLAAGVQPIAFDEIAEDPGDEPRRDAIAGASR